MLSTTINHLFRVVHGTRRQHKGCCLNVGASLFLRNRTLEGEMAFKDKSNFGRYKPMALPQEDFADREI
jgi:hypothetical protein